MIPRDDLRVIAIIPYADKHIESTVERAYWWADEVVVGQYDQAADVEAEAVTVPALETIEALTVAWQEMEHRLEPKDGDYIAMLYSGEVIVDAGAVRKAIRQNPGKRVGVTLYWMWDDTHYREDWQPPRPVFPFIPYRPNAVFTRPAVFIDRGPSYIHSVHPVGVPVGALLAYRFSSYSARERWADHYAHEARSFEPYAEYTYALRQPAQLTKWLYGGLM